MTIELRVELNSVIYGLFRPPASNARWRRAWSRRMIAREYLLDGPQAYSQAIAQADAVTADLQPSYNEADVRAFLALVHEELEKIRPWTC